MNSVSVPYKNHGFQCSPYQKATQNRGNSWNVHKLLVVYYMLADFNTPKLICTHCILQVCALHSANEREKIYSTTGRMCHILLCMLHLYLTFHSISNPVESSRVESAESQLTLSFSAGELFKWLRSAAAQQRWCLCKSCDTLAINSLIFFLLS